MNSTLSAATELTSTFRMSSQRTATNAPLGDKTKCVGTGALSLSLGRTLPTCLPVAISMTFPGFSHRGMVATNLPSALKTAL